MEEDWVSSDEEDGGEEGKEGGVMDLEDLGKVLPEKKKEGGGGGEGGREGGVEGGAGEVAEVSAPREMVTPLQVGR